MQGDGQFIQHADAGRERDVQITCYRRIAERVLGVHFEPAQSALAISPKMRKQRRICRSMRWHLWMTELLDPILAGRLAADARA